jgi:hypothetical protein
MALKHLGAAVKLGVKTQKVYQCLGTTHMRLARATINDNAVPGAMSKKHLQKARFFLGKSIGVTGAPGVEVLHETLITMFQSASFESATFLAAEIIDRFYSYNQLDKIAMCASQCAYMRKDAEFAIHYLHGLVESPPEPYDETDIALLSGAVQVSLAQDHNASAAACEFAFFRRRTAWRRTFQSKYKYDSSSSFARSPSVWDSLGEKCMENRDNVFAALCFAESLRVTKPSSQWSADTTCNLGRMYFKMNERGAALASALTAYRIDNFHLGARSCLLQWDPDKWKTLFKGQESAMNECIRIARGFIARTRIVYYKNSRGIQANLRRFVQRRRFLRLKKATICIQSQWRGYAVRIGKDLETILRNRSTRLIQRIYRGFVARRKALLLRHLKIEGIVIYVQSVVRRLLVKSQFRKWHRGATALQSLWRMHITRLYLYSIGVLPLVRWVQIGASFIPVPMVRRDPSWTVKGGKMWMGVYDEDPAREELDLTINARRLVPNIQKTTYYNAVISHRIQVATDDMNRTVARVERFALQKTTADVEAIQREMQKEDDFAAYHATREKDIQEYLTNIAKLQNTQTTAMAELDRSRRRIASGTPRWLQKIAAAINDLKAHGHQPLTMWRARLQLLIEATIETLREVHGKTQFETTLKKLSLCINQLSADMLRKELYAVIKEGEVFETSRSRDFRALVAEFRAARRKAKRSTMRIHELKRKLAQLNAGNKEELLALKAKHANSQPENPPAHSVASPMSLNALPLERTHKQQLMPIPKSNHADAHGTHALTAEGRLLDRCRQLGSLPRTREDEDTLCGEYAKLLGRCCQLGSWRVALKCHAYMSELGLVRDFKAYRAVLGSLKKSPEHPYPHEIAFAILDEMEDLGMCKQKVLPYLLVMDGIALSEKRSSPTSRSGFWRQALSVFARLRKNGHKATTHVYELLGKCCIRGAPDQVYEALKWAGVPEYLAYSMAQRSLNTIPG